MANNNRDTTRTSVAHSLIAFELVRACVQKRQRRRRQRPSLPRTRVIHCAPPKCSFCARDANPDRHTTMTAKDCARALPNWLATSKLVIACARFWRPILHGERARSGNSICDVQVFGLVWFVCARMQCALKRACQACICKRDRMYVCAPMQTPTARRSISRTSGRYGSADTSRAPPGSQRATRVTECARARLSI